MAQRAPLSGAGLAEQVRARFSVDESIDSVFGVAAETTAASMPDRLRLWGERRGNRRDCEHLLPRVRREIRREWPAFMREPVDRLGRSRAELEERVRALAPWSQPFRLAHGVTTIPDDAMGRLVRASRLKYRRDLILGTVAELLGEHLASTTVLDIGCNSGFFSLDMAARGVEHVDGVDLRPNNIEQARFLAEHYGIENVDFAVSDSAELAAGREYDVVLNLGVLYHVTDPVQFLSQTYDLCRRFAIIDTNCHLEPVSAFMLMGDRDVGSATEGRETLEFLPTYRAAIDAIRYVGFSELFEVTGVAEKPHKSYGSGRRRCFLAVK